MDNLIDYDHFKRDIENSFSELIDKFHLELLIIRRGLYVLKGEKCALRFTYDRGDVFCEFKKPADDMNTLGYGILQVQKYFHPLDHVNIFYDARSQLIEHARIISESMGNILNGDFTWLDEFLKSEREFKNIVSYILKNLDYYHPISRKMRSGDVSWKQDFEKYIVENQIQL